MAESFGQASASITEVGWQNLLAYLCNGSGHVEHRHAFGLAGALHRMPQPVDLTLTIRNLPATRLHHRLYDLSDKLLVRQGSLDRGAVLTLGTTRNDYLLWIWPPQIQVAASSSAQARNAGARACPASFPSRRGVQGVL